LILFRFLPSAGKVAHTEDEDETAPFIKAEPIFEARDRAD
jgi:hypothetical protein